MAGKAGNAEEGLIVDEELEDPPDLIEAGESEDPDEPTGDDPTAAAAEDPDALPGADSEDLEEEKLPNERATAARAADPAPTEERKPAKPESFTYKGDKGEHTLDGAQYYAGDGLYIPDALVPRVKQLLATAAVHNGSWQREKRHYERQVAEATTGRNEKDVAADALMDLVFKDLGALESDEDVYEWAVNFRKNLPGYRTAIKEKQLEQREKQLELRSQPDPEVVEGEITSTASEELDRTLDAIWEFPEMKVLDAEDRKELRARLAPGARRLLTVADRDDPDNGVKKGDYIFDGAAVLEQIRVAAGIKSRTVASSVAARKAAAANARRLGKQPAGPRAPAAARESGPEREEGDRPRDEQTGRFKNREEWNEFMRSGK